MTVRVCRALCVAVAALLALPCAAQSAPLAIATGDGWRGLWRPSATPPTHWSAPDSGLLRALTWQAGQRGIRWAELPLRGDGEGWRTRAIIVRIDPAQVRLALDTAFSYRRDRNGALMRGAAWQVTQVSRRTLLGVNAGQFDATILGTLPWGWIVLNGTEWRPPGVGPLSTAVIIDSAGAVRLLPPTTLSNATRTRGVRFAFQSFPTLLADDGVVPAQLQTGGSGVDLTHRDARLALGVTRDGGVLLVLTRFDAFGKSLGAVPFGLTTPDMAALMGALGCQRAVMLDGGISAQMQLRTATNRLERWPGWRRVPMGLLVTPR